jgi:hypothetical protein
VQGSGRGRGTRLRREEQRDDGRPWGDPQVSWLDGKPSEPARGMVGFIVGQSSLWLLCEPVLESGPVQCGSAGRYERALESRTAGLAAELGVRDRSLPFSPGPLSVEAWWGCM